MPSVRCPDTHELLRQRVEDLFKIMRGNEVHGRCNNVKYMSKSSAFSDVLVKG